VPRTILRCHERKPLPVRTAPAATASPALAGRRIVVVDDDPAVVAAMRALFASWNALAAGGANADSALAAIDYAGANNVDLIVADLRLADGQSGIDAIARLRTVLGAGTPALIVSGDTGTETQAEVLAAGIALLTKPVVAAALKDAAEAALRVRVPACGPHRAKLSQRSSAA
jgi:DNA-binding response OmpR family regulator